MSKMQYRLEELQPYVIGIRFHEGLSVVDVVFKEGWTVPDSTIINKEKVNNRDNHFMFFSDKDGIDIDELLDYVESIIQLNIDKEKKNELFKTKIKELQKLFIDNELDSLENMQFILSGRKNDTDVNFDKVNFDDEIEEQQIEIPKLEEVKVDDPQLEIIGDNLNIKPTNFGGVELPPKGGKIELETYNLPPEALEGPCTHPPSEFCPKCMDGV